MIRRLKDCCKNQRCWQTLRKFYCRRNRAEAHMSAQAVKANTALAKVQTPRNEKGKEE